MIRKPFPTSLISIRLAPIYSLHLSFGNAAAAKAEADTCGFGVGNVPKIFPWLVLFQASLNVVSLVNHTGPLFSGVER